MTVKELIQKLKDIPGDAPVKIYSSSNQKSVHISQCVLNYDGIILCEPDTVSGE